MIAFARAFLVAAVLAGAFAPAMPRAAEVEESPADLPEGEGRDTVFFSCTACHGLAIIKAQGLTRDGWKRAVDEMIARNGMAPPDAADQVKILDYLEVAFPPRRRAPANPFLAR